MGNKLQIHSACKDGDTEEVQKFLEQGGNIDEMDNDQMTGLHLACLHGNNKNVELLLKRGADIHAKNKKNQTPLDLAKRTTNKTIISMLEIAETYSAG